MSGADPGPTTVKDVILLNESIWSEIHNRMQNLYSVLRLGNLTIDTIGHKHKEAMSLSNGLPKELSRDAYFHTLRFLNGYNINNTYTFKEIMDEVPEMMYLNMETGIITTDSHNGMMEHMPDFNIYSTICMNFDSDLPADFDNAHYKAWTHQRCYVNFIVETRRVNHIKQLASNRNLIAYCTDDRTKEEVLTREIYIHEGGTHVFVNNPTGIPPILNEKMIDGIRVDISKGIIKEFVQECGFDEHGRFGTLQESADIEFDDIPDLDNYTSMVILSPKFGKDESFFSVVRDILKNSHNHPYLGPVGYRSFH